MSKKASKKTAAAPAQAESFLDEASTATVQAPAATKAKRTYKARSAKSAVKGDNKLQAAWQLGFKAGRQVAELGA